MRVLTAYSVIVLALAVHNPIADERKTAKQGDVSKQTKHYELQPSVAISGNPQTDSTDSEKGKTEKEPPDYLYRTYLISGPVVGIIAIGTLVLVWRQIVALKNSERAWIMADIEWLALSGRCSHTDTMVGNEMRRTSTVGIRLVCKNDGRTPAWIRERRIGFIIADKLPEKPDLDSLEDILRRPEPVAVGREATWDISLIYPGQIGFDNMGAVYGVVKYQDVFGHNRETFFGYKVTIGNDLERLAEHQEYNKNT